MPAKLALLGLLAAGRALAGERASLAQKMAAADFILEVEASAPPGEVRVGRVVFPPGGEAPTLPPESLQVFRAGSPCWQKAKRRGRLKALLFFESSERGVLTQVAEAEGEDGRYSDLHPAYPKLVEAVAEGATFTEERMRAVGPQLLWRKERAALGRRDNPYLMSLAAEFLGTHGAKEVLDEAWGKPGSAARERNEKRAREPAPENACTGR